jgi:cell shape-determining protein MreC
MKNIIYSIVCAALCSISFGGECVGSCRTPVRSVVSATANAVERVVSAPVRVVKKVANGVQQRRFNRRCR